MLFMRIVKFDGCGRENGVKKNHQHNDEKKKRKKMMIKKSFFHRHNMNKK